jgi:hypothetical protein
LSLSKTFSAFDGIPLGKLIFFFIGKGCASWGRWESHNLSHLLAEGKPWKV